MARTSRTATDTAAHTPDEAELPARLAALESRVAQLEQQAARAGRDGSRRGVDPGDAVPEGVAVMEPQPMDAEARAALEAIKKRIPGR